MLDGPISRRASSTIGAGAEESLDGFDEPLCLRDRVRCLLACDRRLPIVGVGAASLKLAEDAAELGA